MLVKPSSATGAPTLGPADRAFYRDHGYLVLPGVAPEPFLASAQSLLEHLVDDTISGWHRAGRTGDRHAGAPFSTRYHRAWLAAGRPPIANTTYDERFSPSALARWAPIDWLTALAAALLAVDGTAPIDSCFYRSVFPGPAGATVPWHQDAQCLEPISGHAFVTAWIPLVDVSAETSCLEVSPVGPDQELYARRYSDESEYVAMYEADADRLVDVRAIPLQRGDVLLLGPFLPHRSLENAGPDIRWSVDVRLAPIRPLGPSSPT